MLFMTDKPFFKKRVSTLICCNAQIIVQSQQQQNNRTGSINIDLSVFIVLFVFFYLSNGRYLWEVIISDQKWNKEYSINYIHSIFTNTIQNSFSPRKYIKVMNKINSLKNHVSKNFVASDISEKHFQNLFQKKPVTCNVTKNKSRKISLVFMLFIPKKSLHLKALYRRIFRILTNIYDRAFCENS